MAFYEFTVLGRPPLPGEWFPYQPGKYALYPVEDDLLEPLFPQWEQLPVYWGSLEQPGRGIDWCGLNLIPPQSGKAMLPGVKSAPGLAGLAALVEQAAKEGKWMVLYGL